MRFHHKRMTTPHVYRLPELLEKLHSEHTHAYVFRGQSKEYSGPFVPSLYRGLTSSKLFLDYSPEQRLREIGRDFYLQTPPSIDPRFATEEAVQLLGKRMQLIAHYIGTFGYPLGQLLVQQFGYTSDGLDVTIDPRVAAFFATFDFTTKRFISDTREPGIIYRWPVEHSEVTLEQLSTMDFFCCPSYLDGNKLFRLVVDEMSYWIPWIHVGLLTHYIDEALGYRLRGEPFPLELLKLPYNILLKSRVAFQRAGLLLPDMILCQHYLKDKFAPTKKCIIPGNLNAVEDLSTRSGLERFYFFHHETDKEIFHTDPTKFFPNPDDDPFHQVMWVTNYYPGFPCTQLTQCGIRLNWESLPVFDPFRS